MLWYFGWGLLINLVIAVITAVVAEAAILLLRGRQVGATLIDLSAVVTRLAAGAGAAALLPWWQTVLGTTFRDRDRQAAVRGIGSTRSTRRWPATCCCWSLSR